MGNYEDMSSDLIRFKKRTGYDVNIEDPRTHSEYVMRKKYYDRNPLLPLTADKIAVRGLIIEKYLYDILPV